MYSNVLLHGWWYGPTGTSIALNAHFGWVLAGVVHHEKLLTQLVSHHVSDLSGDDLLHKFWKVKDVSDGYLVLSPEEQVAVTHFYSTHQPD